MNSFKAVKDALAFEIQRQAALLEAGEKVVQETRLWDERRGCTVSMRSKEEAQDYRYFPEPDLPVFVITRDQVAAIKSGIPELPREKMQRFIKDYGVSLYEAKILVASKEDAEFAKACLQAYPPKNKKTLVNFLIGPLLSEANSRGLAISGLGVKPPDLVELLGFVEKEQISHLTAKAVLSEMISGSGRPSEIISRKNLIQISDTRALEEEVEAAIRDNPKVVQDFHAGRANALMFLVGRVMKKTSGKANPKLVQEIFRKKLKDA